MGRKGKKTLQGTSVSSMYNQLIEKYIEEVSKKRLLSQPSKAQVVEDSILVFLEKQGILEQLLKSVGCLDEEVKSIRAHLKAEYDLHSTT